MIREPAQVRLALFSIQSTTSILRNRETSGGAVSVAAEMSARSFGFESVWAMAFQKSSWGSNRPFTTLSCTGTRRGRLAARSFEQIVVPTPLRLASRSQSRQSGEAGAICATAFQRSMSAGIRRSRSCVWLLPSSSKSQTETLAGTFTESIDTATMSFAVK